MLRLFARGLLFWLCVFEALAAAAGWRGLAWLGGAVPRWLLLPLAAWLVRRPDPLSVAALGLSALPAVLLQTAASSLRQQQLNPLLRLQPGEYPAYQVTRLDIPLSEGYMPALHIVPAQGARAAVCVLHGSGCNKTFYAWQLVDRLVAHGIALLLVDLDGHGENPRWQAYPAMLENASAGVCWLRGHYQRVGLLGVSLGGCLAAKAVAEGLAVDGLVLLEAPPHLHYRQRDITHEALALVQPRLLYMLRDCSPYHLYHAWESPRIRALISTWDLIAACDLLGSLPQIRVPLLMVYGGRDAIVKPVQAAQARAVLPPQGEFQMVHGASHLTLLVTPQTLALLGAWLGDVLLGERLKE